MKFRTYVEPLEPMRSLEIPPEVVEALGGGKRPAGEAMGAGRHAAGSVRAGVVWGVTSRRGAGDVGWHHQARSSMAWSPG